MFILFSAILAAFCLYLTSIKIIYLIHSKKDFSILKFIGGFLFAYLIFCILGIITSLPN